MKAKITAFTKQLIIVLLLLSAIVVVYDIIKKTKESKSFKDLASAFENKKSLPYITVETPIANSIVAPGKITITGKASGSWFFEGQFSLVLTNHRKQPLVHTTVFSQGDWMTTEAVPFKGVMNVPESLKGSGFLVFTRDNPSGDGLPDEFLVPVLFE